jgi:hypothetical protein
MTHGSRRTPSGAEIGGLFELRQGGRQALVGENGFLFYPQGKG